MNNNKQYWLLHVSVYAALCVIHGCSFLQQDHLQADRQFDGVSPYVQCGVFLSELDSAIADETHFDPALKRVSDFPFLRVNRFLASYDFNSLSSEKKSAWFEQAKALGLDAYHYEIQRLPTATQQRLIAHFPANDIQQFLQDCYALQLEPEIIAPASYEMPDNYSTAQRFFGLYSLVSHLAKPSIEEYRNDMIDRYTQKRGAAYDSQIEYRATQQAQLSTLPPILQTALGIPQLSAAQQTVLLQRNAPVISLQAATDNDAIGSPEWNKRHGSTATLRINTQEPNVYTYTSYTRHKQQVLLQLNYAFWFPARTALKDPDIYAGELDGIIWRVTLDKTFRPILFDSIHLCGCYHKLYLPPGSSIALDQVADEQPLAFEIEHNHKPPHLTISAAEHYIIDVSIDEPDLQPKTEETTTYERLYKLKPFSDLLLLAHKDFNKPPKSMFGASGIIAQSNRTERFMLWPLGVPAAGSMRLPGMHAIAFIGKRHFDDADLLNTLGFDY